MQTHYTYCHTRNDTGQVFYIGKGVKYRANATKNRNQYWKNIVEKYGYSIEILANSPATRFPAVGVAAAVEL